MQTWTAHTSQFIDIDTLAWQPTPFDGIEMKILYSDPETGMSTILFRMAPGAVVPMHEHTGVEQTYMISGSLEDHEGAATAGNYVWRPGGSRHVARAPHGALFISFFTKPNRFEAGTRFYTE
jgi:anti-sigma factor ChrR (cupin superfamily)